MEDMTIANIGALVAVLVSIGGLVVNWYRTRGEGANILSEGYERLAPRLIARIDELEKDVKTKDKALKDMSARIRAIEDQEHKRAKGVSAAIGLLEQTIENIQTTIAILKEMQ